LQETERRHAHAPRAGRKKYEWNGGQGSGEDQQQVFAEVNRGERARSGKGPERDKE